MLAHTDFHLGLIAWVQGDDARARELRESAEGYDHGGAPTDAIDPLRYLGLLACAARISTKRPNGSVKRGRACASAAAVLPSQSGWPMWRPWPRREGMGAGGAPLCHGGGAGADRGRGVLAASP